MRTAMKVISEKALRDRLADYLAEIEATGEELWVTENGQLVLKILSFQRHSYEVDAHPKERTNHS
jgi:antitoxin (DNA-binding transcriptional repressor) of toxin-antitoxin stability system